MSAIKLNVEGLNVRFVSGQKETHAVRDVSFTLGREKLAIVGESGSGKSTVGRSLLKLHPPSARITAKAMAFGEVDLLSASEKAMQKIRGQRISMIMQDPKYSLNPVVKVGDH
ncbi:MAG TPA: peptide ABC transporter ATP-binding protein, partial [Pseudomonas sp.]|nr:peptide ABC transporter ATP-binding protein [Pseudomonas sp.]